MEKNEKATNDLKKIDRVSRSGIRITFNYYEGYKPIY